MLSYGTSSTVTAGNFTWIGAAPTITSIAPSTGPVAGGTAVTITGTNFTGATAVSFGGVAATSFTVNSATSITATSPAGAVGQAAVSVTTASGTASTAAGAGFLYYAVPSVASMTPGARPDLRLHHGEHQR